MGQVSHSKLFDWGKLFGSLTDPDVGLTLIVSLIYSFAFGLFIYAYQPVAVKIVHLTPTQISILFTVFGIIGLIAQMFIVPRVTRAIGDRKALTGSLVVLVVTFFGFFLSRNLVSMVLVSIIQSLANSFVAPLIQALLSKEVDARSQGSILGINASYVSLGMIFGPIIGGAVASFFIPLPFLFGSLTLGVCVFLSLLILRKPHKVQSAF
jgi:MFS family permease